MLINCGQFNDITCKKYSDFLTVMLKNDAVGHMSQYA